MMTNEKRKLKPYDLVQIDREGYSHLAEIISRPMEDTIMVRNVVNDPSTLEEIPLRLISGKSGAGEYRYVHYARVTGKFRFPVDMLRYDFASPVNFKIHTDDFGRVEIELNEGEAQCIVARCTRLKKANYGSVWTDDRWNSFGWRVEEMKTLKIEKGV